MEELKLTSDAVNKIMLNNRRNSEDIMDTLCMIAMRRAREDGQPPKITEQDVHEVGLVVSKAINAALCKLTDDENEKN